MHLSNFLLLTLYLHQCIIQSASSLRNDDYDHNHENRCSSGDGDYCSNIEADDAGRKKHNSASRIGTTIDHNPNGTTITTTATSKRNMDGKSNSNSNSNSNSHQRTDDQFPKKCQCQPHYKGSIDGGGRIAYLITAHDENTLRDALILLKKIIAPGYIVLIHLDKKLSKKKFAKSELREFLNEKNDSSCHYCGADIYFERRYLIEWGKWSMMKPTLWAMHELTFNKRFKKKWDVFINLSADSFPVYTPKTLSEMFLGPLKNINFVTTNTCLTDFVPTLNDEFKEGTPKKYFNAPWYPISYVEYENSRSINSSETNELVETEKKDAIIKVYYGSQWVTLTSAFVEDLAMKMTKPNSFPVEFKKILKQKKIWMTDEIFLSTIISYHPFFNTTLPKMNENKSLATMDDFFSIRFERMDEDKQQGFLKRKSTQRYEVPQSSSLQCPMKWGPYYLGVYDLADIRKNGSLFIRKVSVDLDPNMIELLPVDRREDIPNIDWPNEMKISTKIPWDRFDYDAFIEQQIRGKE